MIGVSVLERRGRSSYARVSGASVMLLELVRTMSNEPMHDAIDGMMPSDMTMEMLINMVRQPP
jgi:hypothetical protein